MQTWKLDQDKFDNLAHYIIWRCPDLDKLGSTKFHKILWKSDTENFLLRGKPITGARYIKHERGPVTNELLRSRDRLKADGRIDFWLEDRFAGDYSKYGYKSLVPPPANFLSKDEEASVDYWIEEICMKHTANSISEESHGYAWEIAKMGEELPMEAALVERGREPEGEELERAKQRARELGLI